MSNCKPTQRKRKMKGKVIIILGSSRSDGETKKLTDTILGISDFDKIDLNDYSISYYDYEYKNANDDYLNLMQTLINKYDTFVFATPVYWYSMSGIMKVFLDRFTDLLDNQKELGRQLRNKKMTVITSSNGGNLGEEFWFPFKETAKYLGMEYIGNLHTISNSLNLEQIEDFVYKIKTTNG
ncbi:flavodoxin family protein [Flavobacterium soli]|uniref:flavodoxin family protein n=1 Tax=Flavobacterium soli TaxID=344881 RepID=UPI001FE18726|nr:flavodoxin family protein [Flavobacterium soli]